MKTLRPECYGDSKQFSVADGVCQRCEMTLSCERQVREIQPKSPGTDMARREIVDLDALELQLTFHEDALSPGTKGAVTAGVVEVTKRQIVADFTIRGLYETPSKVHITLGKKASYELYLALKAMHELDMSRMR